MHLFIYLAVLIYLVSGCSKTGEDGNDAYEKALKFVAEGNDDAARLELLNTVKYDPTHANALYELGEIAMSGNNPQQALQYYSKARDNDPLMVKAAERIADILVRSRNYGEALIEANTILAKDANNIAASRIKAAAHIGREEYGQAGQVLDGILASGDAPSAFLALKALQLKQQDHLEEALEHINLAISRKDEQYYQYMDIRTSINAELADVEAYESDLIKIYSELPNSRLLRERLIQFYVSQSQIDEALLIAESSITTAQDKDRAIIDLLMLRELESREKAKASLAEYRSAYPESIEIALFETRYLAEDSVETHLISLIDDKRFSLADRNKARLRLGDYRVTRERYDEALLLYEEILEIESQNRGALLGKASVHMERNDHVIALNTLRSSLRHHPNDERALMMLAQTYQATGADRLAKDAYQQVLTINPTNINAVLVVFRQLLKEGDLIRAEQRLLKAMKAKPENAVLKVLLSELLFIKNEHRAALEVGRSLQEDTLYMFQSHMIQGLAQQALGRQEFARDHFLSAIHQSPARRHAYHSMLSTFTLPAQIDSLVSVLSNLKETFPEEEMPILVTASVHSAAKDYKVAHAVLDEYLITNPSSEAVWLFKSQIFEQQADIPRAADAIISAINHSEHDQFLRLTLANLFHRNDKREEAAREYRSVISKAPDNLIARNNLATILLESPSSESLKEALNLAEPLRLSSHPAFLDTYGWALVKNNQAEKGERFLRMSWEINKSAIAGYHLARALIKMQRPAEASKILAVVQRDFPENKTIQKKARAALVEAGE